MDPKGARESRGTPEYLFTKKCLRIVVSMAYPEVVAYLTSTRGLTQAKDDLEDAVKKIARQMMAVWHPKPQSMKKILKQLFKFVGDTKLKLKFLEKDDKGRPLKISITDKDCVFCPAEIRGLSTEGKFAFCMAADFFVEECLRILFKRRFKFGFPYDPDNLIANAETFASQSIGDKNCVHVISFTYIEVPML